MKRKPPSPPEKGFIGDGQFPCQIKSGTPE